MRTLRQRPPLAVAAVTVGALLATVAAGPAGAAAPEPALSFVAASNEITLQRWEGEPVYLDTGAHIVAGRNPFEIRLKRASYDKPIVVKQVIRDGGATRTVTLPSNLVTDFTGFAKFSHLTVTDANGRKVVDRDHSFCPNGYGARTRPDAPDRSPYPSGCPYNPFTIGSVWGIQAGWSTPMMEPWSESADLADGTYTATQTIKKRYRDLFGIPANQATITVKVTVVTEDLPTDERRKVARAPREGAAAAAEPTGPGPRPAAARPTGKASVPAGPKPDLRSLPAFGIEIGAYQEGEPDGRDYLSFAATVWVGGDSPLVVDGFRRAGQDLMDAYQYFYDANGKQIGYSPVGTMEWDARDGHHHWHFTDFAQYRLLDSSKKVAVRSGKEAFCLANTDAVDYTLAKANWRPENTDLHTACGSSGSLAVREVLDVGNGDTYGQFLPGQSFDITDLPNGTYYVEVAANPDQRLHESNTKNNVSLRKVILGGEPGARTVKVPPHQGING